MHTAWTRRGRSRPGGRRAAAAAPKAPDLTEREIQVLTGMSRGRSNAEIAARLVVSEATVKTHITAIMSKINARRRTQAVLLANTVRLFEAG